MLPEQMLLTHRFVLSCKNEQGVRTLPVHHEGFE